MGNLPSGLPEEIDDRENLARFLTSRGQFTSMFVKPAAFLPSPRDMETSVSRHGREPSKRLWKIGSDAAGIRSLHGAAILKASAIRFAALDVLADEPPDRHAAIRNWPTDSDPVFQKARQRERAVELASAAGTPFLMTDSDP